MSETNQEVKLAKEGTIMARFQKERTDAISEMFDNPYKFDTSKNEIYPTSKFFVRLDKALQKALDEQRETFYSNELPKIEKKIKEQQREEMIKITENVPRTYGDAIDEILEKIKEL